MGYVHDNEELNEIFKEFNIPDIQQEWEEEKIEEIKLEQGVEKW